MNDNYEKIKEIIENGYGIDEIKYIFKKNNNNYNDILYNVIYNQDYKTFEHIKPYLNLEDRNSWLLNIAIKKNDIYFFNYFIDNCGDDITDALELSAEIGNSLMVQKILNKKNYNVDVNNALRYAVIENNIECVKLLLPLSSNYNNEIKVFSHAIKNKNIEMINLIYNHFQYNKFYSDALSFFVSENKYELCKRYLDLDINLEDKNDAINIAFWASNLDEKTFDLLEKYIPNLNLEQITNIQMKYILSGKLQFLEKTIKYTNTENHLKKLKEATEKDFKFEIINENIKKSLELINDAILNLKLKEELFKDDFKEKNKRKI